MKIWRFVIAILLGCSSLGVAQPPPVFVWYGACGGGPRRGCVRDNRSWIYVVSSDYYNGRDGYVHCSYSSDNGVSWSLPWTLNFVGANVYGVGPAIAIDRGDSLWVAWRQTYFDSLGTWKEDVFWSEYNDSPWTPAANLSNQGTGAEDHWPSLVVDLSNHPHVVWDMDGSVFYSRHDGTSWTSPEIASDGGSYMPTLAVDSAGDLHLAYYVGNISYRKRTGGVWSAPTVIGSGTHPSIVVDFLGHPHVVWTSFIYPYDILYSYFNGTSWSPPLNLSNNFGLSESPTISCDFRNNLYVAWEDNSLDTTKFPRIFYRTYDGSSWSATAVISVDTINYNGGPTIGYPVTDSGVDIAWSKWQGQWAVYYRRLPLVGSGVEGERPVEPREEGLQLSVHSPARSQLVVRYFLPPSKIQNLKSKISLYDLSGRMVAVLGEGVMPSGWHELRAPLTLPSGVYFLRLEVGKSSLTRKFVLLR